MSAPNNTVVCWVDDHFPVPVCSRILALVNLTKGKTIFIGESNTRLGSRIILFTIPKYWSVIVIYIAKSTPESTHGVRLVYFYKPSIIVQCNCWCLSGVITSMSFPFDGSICCHLPSPVPKRSRSRVMHFHHFTICIDGDGRGISTIAFVELSRLFMSRQYNDVSISKCIDRWPFIFEIA